MVNFHTTMFTFNIGAPKLFNIFVSAFEQVFGTSFNAVFS